jgi:hypothetical protein
MAGFFQQVLKGAAEGFFNDAYLRDFRHASKTFTTDGFSNAPKFKWLFHVYFDINTTLMNSDAFPDAKLPGLLVKNITLPKYNMAVAEMNQYNRKRYVQTKINYDPVSITFHDDNAGSIKKMWYNYYSYYYNDTTSANLPVNVLRNSIYMDDVSDNQNWGYMGEPSSSTGAAAIGNPKANFFNSIKIFGFNQHNFSCYTLVNPIIDRFEHDTYDYYQTNGIMENRMTVRYETVTYQEGAINGQKPGEQVLGFGSDEYYDKLLSPISKPGGNRSILGQGGLVDAGEGILKDLSEVPPNILGAVTKGLNAGRTVKAMGGVNGVLTATKAALVAGATAAAGGIAASATRSVIANFPSKGSGSSGASQVSGNQNVPSTQAPPLPPNP